MENKRGFGKGSRNDGYKGASKGGWNADSRGSRNADTRGGRPADSRGSGSIDSRGSRSTDSRSYATADTRGGRPADSRGFGSTDSRGPRSTGSRNTGTADDRFGKSTESRGPRSSDFRGGRPLDSRSTKATDFRGGRPSENHFGKPAADRFSKLADGRGPRPDVRGPGPDAGNSGLYTRNFGQDTRSPGSDTRDPRQDTRSSRPDAHSPRLDTRSPRLDARDPRQDTRSSRPDARGLRTTEPRVADEANLIADEFTANQGDLDKLEGRNSVLEALKSGRSINRIFVAKGDREGSVNQIIAMARQSHILIQEIDRSKLDDMSVTHAHQGVIALTAAKDYVEVDDILASAAESGRPPFIIILDEITDSHNLGSMLRTANAAGVHGVIIPKRRAIGLTSVVSKASAGAIEYVPVARVTNIVQTIESLKKQNIWVVGTDSTGDRSYFDRDLTGPIALVIGSEGEGMGKLVRESCDFIVNIPMMGQISSLNAAVAGAVVTYEILRQRSKKQP